MYKQDFPPPRSPEPSDTILVELTLAGDEEAFECLVLRYQAALYNFIGRCVKDYELARDILQFVFLQLHVSLPRLQLNLTSTRTRSPLKAWLFQVAWNRSMDELRKKRPLLFCELETIDEDEELTVLSIIPDKNPQPDEIAEHHDLQRHLQQAIQTLPPRFRSVVLLRYTQELTFVEIGRILDMPENTAKTYFQRARPLLRAALSPYRQADVMVHS